jgi:ABC-type Na+ efflux pump permease subunit
MSGYAAGTDIYEDEEALEEKSNNEILPVFNMILTYVTIFVIYMIIILYGNSILQNIVLEKSSKLMDTMLISVAPQAMIFGKMIGVLLAGLIQLFIWIVSVVIGFFAGTAIYDRLFEGVGAPVVVFFKSFAELGLFRPANVVLGILSLVLGIVLYASMSAIAGAISGSREEATSKQGIIIMILVVCFYLVLIKGLTAAETPMWLYYLPFTSAMILPSAICTGSVSMILALESVAIMAVCVVVFIVLAGRLYKMMSLYKGSPVKIDKAIKMLLTEK